MRSFFLAVAASALLTALFALAFGCAPLDADVEGSAVDDALAVESALEDAGGDDAGLCARLETQRARGALVDGALVAVESRKVRVHVGTAGDERIQGTPGPDLIFGLAGDDKLFGEGGNDVICAGAGNDFVDGGLGQDRIFGEGDADILHGGGAGDWVHGGGGPDEVYGDLLDDKLFGDDGDDLLVGGHGTDAIDGGAGDDWLRGDTNGDEFDGGPGDDVVSFMTARPTGRAVRDAPFVIGIDLDRDRANGDGAAEPLVGVERFVGSAFADRFSGSAARFSGGLGDDVCDGEPCAANEESVPRGLPFVFVDARPRDTGLVVLGSRRADDLSFRRRDDGAVVVTERSGAALFAGGAHCEQTARDVVTCRPAAPLRWLMAWGDDGDDTLVVDGRFPRDFTAHLDGGDGDDHLVGGPGGDVLFTGRSGADVVDGRAGDDALISESYAGDRRRSGRDYEGGADTLLGRRGDDQLVSDYPCGGHLYSGGRGVDIAGFARVGDRSIHAQLRGPVADEDRSRFFGMAFLPGVCDVDAFGTHLDADLEILEGSKGADTLLGNDRRNVIWGRQGDDVVRGFGGADLVYGHEGRDDVAGGAGDDLAQD